MSERPKNLTLRETLANQNEKKQKRDSKSVTETGPSAWFAWIARISLLFALCASPWMIASVNFGAQFIISVALLIGLSCWWIETALSSKRRQVIPYITLLVLLGLCIGYFQTVSLPSSVANIVAGRQVEIGETFLGASEGDPVRLSLDVESTWNYLRLLVMAMACLLMGGRYFRSSQHLALFFGTTLINGVALTAFGLVQKFRFNGKLFWSIELTGGGSPFGPFVNRNNAAGYLVMCIAAGAGLLLFLMTKKEVTKPHLIVSKEMPVWRQVTSYLAIFFSELDAKRLAVIIACVFISMGVVATLSRGGVLTMFGGFVGAALVYNVTRKPRFAGLLLFPVALMVLAIAAWAGFADEIIQRFERIDTLGETTIDGRLSTWRDTLPASMEHGWFGAGLGSYRSVHRMYRTDPEMTLFDYAENQFVQSLVEAGIPGLILVVLAIGLSVYYLFFLLARGKSGVSVGVGVFGSLLVTSQVIAAFFDFGWYIPANMILFATGVGILGFHSQSLAGRLKKKSVLRFEMPGFVCQTLILITFLLGIFVVYDLYQKSSIDSEISLNLRKDNFDVLDLEQTNRKIEALTPRVKSSLSSKGLNFLGDLHVHRARLQYLAMIKAESRTAALKGEDQIQVERNLWNLTGLVRMHELIKSSEKGKNYGVLAQIRNSDFFQYDLPQALVYYRTSQKIAPLQPPTQLLIGQLTILLQSIDKAKLEFDRTVALSPQNPDYRLLMGIHLLQSGETTAASEQFRHYLRVMPRGFEELMRLVTGRTTRNVEAMTDRAIFEEIIEDEPRQLYQFAMRFMRDQDLKTEVLNKADDLLVDISMSDSRNLMLKASVNLALGNAEVGRDFLERVVTSNPSDQNARFQLAKTLLDFGELEQANEHAERLVQMNSRLSRYKSLLREIKLRLKEREEKPRAFFKQKRPSYRISWVGKLFKEVTP